MSRKVLCMLGVVLCCTTALMAAPEKTVAVKNVQDLGVEVGPGLTAAQAMQVKSSWDGTSGSHGAKRGMVELWDNFDDLYGGWTFWFWSQDDRYTPYHNEVADDFILMDDAVIDEVHFGMCWWNPEEPDPVIEYVRILIYPDDGDQPTGSCTIPCDPFFTAIFDQDVPWADVYWDESTPYPRTWWVEVPITGAPVLMGGTKYWVVIMLVHAFPPQSGPLAAGAVKMSPAHTGGFFNDYWEPFEAGDPPVEYGTAFILMGNYGPTDPCGNNIREGWEQCDGTDDDLCPGECIPPGEPEECMCPYVPCNVDCPPQGIPGETDPCDDSTDTNNGLHLDPCDEALTEITLQCGVTVCGVSWLVDGAVDYDQYSVTIPSDQYMTVTFQAEFPAYCGFLIYTEGLEGSGDCDDLSGYWYPHATPKCTVRTWAEDCLPGGTYFLQMAVNWGQAQLFPCTSPYNENDYYITLDCEPCTILRCPETPEEGGPSLFEQVAQSQDSDYWYASASDEALGVTWYEDFEDVWGDVCDIHFWGLMHDYVVGEDCIENPMTFEIEFFRDDAVTQIGSTYTIPIVPIDTFHVYDPDPYTPGDEMVLWEFSADLNPCVPLYTGDPVGENQTGSGWVSIRAMGTNDCLFYWAAHDVCDPDAFSLVSVWEDPEWVFHYDLVDWSLCLTGDPGELVLGACCWEPTGDCYESEISSCVGVGYRFEPYITCADLDPPCGVIAGACCDPDTGCCTYTTLDECMAAGGTFTMQGDCYPNTCPQPDPCDDPTVIYQQTPYDDNPDTIPFNYRNYGGDAIITAADVVFEADTEITDFHWWATDETCFQWSGFDDVLIFEDVAGEPGPTVLIEVLDIPNFQAFYNGETIWSGEREVKIYTIDLGEEDTPDPINLTAGTYWIGMRPVGMIYDWSAIMVTAAQYNGTPYRQKWDDEGAWIAADPEDPDIAFCLTYYENGCPAVPYFDPWPPREDPDVPGKPLVDARQPYPDWSTTPSYGIGMPDDPNTGVDESALTPIIIDLGMPGVACSDCFEVCVDCDGTPGTNSIANCADNGDGTYTLILDHGIDDMCYTTVRYTATVTAGPDYVGYYAHPANADGSALATEADLDFVMDCASSGTCELWEADINFSGSISINDFFEELDLLNGAAAYDPYYNTVHPASTGLCAEPAWWCPPNTQFIPNPPDGTIDARKDHSYTVTTPCYGFGMPDDPYTTSRDESTFYPIVIDIGVAGAYAECWSLCETPDMSGSDCGSNSIASVTDNGDGTYTIALNHGVQGGTVTTIQYLNGGDYVEYIHHPANADGSSTANASDILTVVDCLNNPGTCEDYRADIDASGLQGASDIIEEVDLLNGAGAYDPWFGTLLPENTGDCP